MTATLEQQGNAVERIDVAAASDVDARRYDAVVAAASLHAGRHQRRLIAWAKRNAEALARVPSAFISASLTAAEGTDEAREAVQDAIDDFAEETGWKPTRRFPVAGCLQYRQYGLLTRMLMRLKLRAGDHPTDVSRNYEYTDWDSVERFALQFADLLADAPSPAPAVSP